MKHIHTHINTYTHILKQVLNHITNISCALCIKFTFFWRDSLWPCRELVQSNSVVDVFTQVCTFIVISSNYIYSYYCWMEIIPNSVYVFSKILSYVVILHTIISRSSNYFHTYTVLRPLNCIRVTSEYLFTGCVH